MSQVIDDKHFQHAMYRRWAYMVLAIIASAILFSRPVLSFQDDKGIIYVRSFSMDEKVFRVIQTELTTNISQVSETMSVKGLYYCNQVMLYGSILCLLCFFSDRWRIRIAMLTALAAGVYYGFLIYYSMQIADLHFATLAPNIYTFIPAIILELMLLIRHNILQTFFDRDEAGLA